MSKKPQVVKFDSPELGEVTGIIKDGEPWFLAGQVCRALGIKNSSDAVASIDTRMKIAGLKGVGSSYTLLQTAGGSQKVQIINEQYLYELIFQSRKQKAVKFRAWVTGEVLPALRKTGQYRMEGKIIRRIETDAIKQLVQLAMEQGSQSAQRYYAILSGLVNDLVGVKAGMRDSLTSDKLEEIAILEKSISHIITREVNEGTHYKQIYQIVKAKVSAIADNL